MNQLMKVSDISMYPSSYCQPIIDFIERSAQNPSVTIQRTVCRSHLVTIAMYDTLDSKMLKVLEQIPETVFVTADWRTDREKANIHAC